MSRSQSDQSGLPGRAAVRPGPVFVSLVGLTAGGAALSWRAGSMVTPLAYFGVFVMVICGWLVSLCLHEFGHAVTAWHFGDHGVATRGYLTLNPLRYSNPMLSLGLPLIFIALGGIGLPGGAVYVQTSFMSPIRRTLVSLAGPAANVVLATVLLVAARAYFDPAHAVLCAGVAFLGFLQVTAVVLNVLPIPGLDGYGALEPHLSAETRRALDPVKAWGVLAVFILLISPALNRWFFSIVSWFVELPGISPRLVFSGMSLTQFWGSWL